MKSMTLFICWFLSLLCFAHADEVSKEFQITIAGNVKTPINMLVSEKTKVSEMLAAAGDASAAGSPIRISIIRCNEPTHKNEPTELFTIKVFNLVKGENPTVADLEMRPKDQLYLNKYVRIK